MPQTISRLFNFVNDKNNGIPITSSRVDAELNQLVSTLNESVIVTATMPASPFNGQLWFNLNTNYLEEYRNNEWIILGPVHVSTSVMVTPQNGDIWYNPTTFLMQYYNSSANANTGGWISLARWALGATIASATTITLGNDGNVFQISGTTGITSITAGIPGQMASLYFQSALTVTNGSNLKLNSNLITVTGTIIHIICDGTNWYEISRTPSRAPYIKLSNKQSSGTNGGTPVSGSWLLYPLNILESDTAGIVTQLPIFQFTVNSVVVTPGVGSTWTNNGQIFTVVSTAITGSTGTVNASGTGQPAASGLLTKTSGTGDLTLTFSAEVLLGIELSLPPGIYEVEGKIPFYDTDSSQVRLFNITTSTLLLSGSNTNALSTSFYPSFVEGQFTITAQNTIALQYQVGLATTNGFGVALSFGPEVYGQLQLKKVG